MSKLAPDFWEGTDYLGEGKFDNSKVYSNDIPATPPPPPPPPSNPSAAFNDENRSYVTSLYNEFLGRDGSNDAAGVDYWTKHLTDDGWSRDKVRRSIGSSDEANQNWLTSAYRSNLGRAADFDSSWGASHWEDQLKRDISGGMSINQARSNVLRDIKGSDEYKFRGNVDQLVGRARNQQIGDVSALDKFLGSDRNTFGLTADSSGEAWRDAFVGRDESGVEASDSWYQSGVSNKQDLENLLLRGWYTETGGDGGDDVVKLPDGDTYDPGGDPPVRDGDGVDIDDITEGIGGMFDEDDETDPGDEGEFFEGKSNDSVIAEALTSLQDMLAGAFDSIPTIDTSSITDAITRVEGDLTELTEEFSGLDTFDSEATTAAIEEALGATGFESSIADLQTKYAGLDNLGDNLANAFGTQLDDTNATLASIQSTIDSNQSTANADLNNLQTEFDNAKLDFLDQLDAATASSDAQINNLTNLFGATAAAGATQISDLKDMLNAQTESAASDREAFQNQLVAQQQQAASNQQAMLASRNQMISNLNSQWGQRMQQSQAAMNSRLQAAQQQYETQLNNLSQNMNYRILGDNAEGVQLRRSEAFKKGNTSRGTNQLSRAMRINTLNI
tara:strand:- start:28 stop:1875 length:1848 start_codon:yes stop_codon:yes gene_type:complete